MNQKAKIQTLLDNTPFPGAGQSIGGHQVIESAVDLQGKNWAIYLRGKLSSQQVKKALKKLTSTHFALPVQDKFSLVTFTAKGMTHARTNPPGDVTVVRGHMYYARPNPISSSEFDKEMDEMLIDNPEKHFTKYTVKNQDQLHERLWKGVSYAGEAYGWQKGDDLWHRRASFIMPKIKINKALKGATMFYHTHPAKDEPSLTSADDIQFYLDLHFRWGIKDFYTVMKHKLDYFKITGKKGGKEKYLRMEEEAFVDAVDGLIEEGEKVAKKEVGEDSPDVDFQNRITKEMVTRFNKKFSNIAKISFRPKRKNPRSKLAKKSASPLSALLALRPNPPIRVEDKYVAKALDELKGLDYAHEHYGADEYGHTMYVYWWLKHHLAPTPKQPKGRLFKLNEYGLDSDTRKKLRQYLSQPVIGNYNNMDVVYLLALYHDIAKLREKNAKEPGWEIGAEMFRKEIGPELKLPEKLIEDLAFLLNTDLGRKGITDTDFLPQAGDYYGACKLVHMADMITHHPTMYTKQGGELYKQEAMVQMIDQLRDFLDHNYVLPNPPPRVTTLKWISSYGLINLTMEEVEELLGEFHQSVVPDEDGNLAPPGDRSSGGHLYSMRFNAEVVPGLSRPYKANFALSSSNLNITVGKPVPEDLGKQDANLIYQAVGERLKESYPDIELEPVEPEAIVNPRHAGKIQVILISGPSGGGKSTVLKYLHRHLPDSSIPPTYTTRPRRPTDGADRKFVTKATFKKMIEQGKLVEYVVGGNGHYYGRVFDDFEGKYAIVEVTLQGKKHYETRFPNVFSIYLDPDPKLTEKDRAKAIFRRGGLSMEEAKRRAKVATENVKKSKKVNFDLRVTMKKGNYLDGARRVLHNLPLNNPSEEEDEDKKPPKKLTLKDFGVEGFTPPPAERVYLGEEFVQPPTTQPELDEVGVDISGAMEADLFDKKEAERRQTERTAEAKKRLQATKQAGLPFDTVQLNEDEEEENPPKDLFDWFEEWSELINMKNKEMKAFMKSPWFKVAGLTPAEAKKMGIKSGQNSFRAIIRMRKKLGLTGPKDYIDYRKPRTVEAFYEKAVDKWNQTDWDWCKTQVRFNKRHSGFPYNKAKESTKGPLIKKQKTQNQPSRRLLGLWVWAHDPWRWARKQGVTNMPKCPDVPWVGMTEKRKYGKLEVIDGPPARRNPPQVYYHGSPVDNIEVLRKGSYVTPDYQTAYDMGRYYTKTGETWEDDDLEYPMKWGTSPVFKQGREPNGVPTVYTVELYDDDLTALGQDEDGVNWEYRTNIEAPVEIIDAPSTRSNPPSFEFSRDPAKRKKRWEMITNSTSEELLKKAYDMAEEAGLYIEAQLDQLPPLKMKNVPKTIADEIEKWYYSSVDNVSFYMARNEDNKMIGLLQRVVIHRPIPTVVKDWILNYNTKHRSKKNAPFISGFRLFRYSRYDGMVVAPAGRWVGLPFGAFGDKKLRFPAKSYPLLYDNRAGGSVKEEEQFQGYYAIIKMFEASYMEKHGIEGYGMGTSLQRAEYYRSFGWLMPQDVSKYAPYIHEGPRSYLLLDEGDVLGWDSSLNYLWRPVYSARSNPHYTPPPGVAMFPGELHQGPAALYQQTISISQLNPPRSKPFPWNKARVKKSPFKTMKRAKATYASWKAGNVIGSTATSSLKSMGKIPRASGKYELGEKYARINPPELLPVYNCETCGVKGMTHTNWYCKEHGEVTRANPHGGAHRVPKKYEGQDPSEHSDLYTDEDPKGTIKGLGFKDKTTAEKSIRLIENSGKTHAHKIQAAMAMEQRARFHPHQTKGIKQAQKVYAKFIEEMKKQTKRNPGHCPIEKEARRAASDPSFIHHEWYIEHHLDYVMAIANALLDSDKPEDQQLIRDMVWMHDYPKMLGDKDNFELVEKLVSKYRSEEYTKRLMYELKWMELIKQPNKSPIRGHTPYIATVMSTADALAHYYGPFFQIFHDENPDTPIAELKKKNKAKLEKDKLKLRAGPMEGALDSIKFQYKGRKVRVTGNEHIAEMIEKKNPPLTFEEIIPVIFEISEDRQYTLFNRLIKLMEESGEIAEEVLIKEGFKPYKEPGKDGVEGEITDAIVVLLMAFERSGGTPEELKDLLHKSISKSGTSLKRNPRTPGGRKVPTRYLKGLTKLEKLIAEDEIDKGYKYDVNDPEAYKFWQSDIKATARGLKIGPSKHRIKYYKKYRKNINKDYKPSGKTPKQKFLNRIRKETKIKKSILEKIYDKGLAAWRTGHRPGVQQHQWAAGRVYAFVVGADSSTGPGKPDHKLAVEAGVR